MNVRIAMMGRIKGVLSTVLKGVYGPRCTIQLFAISSSEAQ